MVAVVTRGATVTCDRPGGGSAGRVVVVAAAGENVVVAARRGVKQPQDTVNNVAHGAGRCMAAGPCFTDLD